MGKPTNARLIVLGLLLLAGASACERGIVKESSIIASSTAQFTFDLSAAPNVLYATDARRDSSLIKLVVKDGGAPVKDAVVYFTIQVGPAMFSDYSRRVTSVSNEVGIASATILGPLLSEFDQADANVIVSAEVETTAPQIYFKQVSLSVLGPAAAGITMSLTAYPSILTAFDTARDTSVITAVLRNGIIPVEGAAVHFTVRSGPGIFTGWIWDVTVVSNENGIASVNLLGPMASEMAGTSADIIVSAEVQTTPTALYREFTIKVQKAP